MKLPGLGAVGCLTRRLTGAHDPVALHAALASGGGAMPFLLRRTRGVALIAVDTALRVEAIGTEAKATARSEGGEMLLAQLRRRLDQHGPVFAFPRCEAAEEEVRMADPGALATLRAALAFDASGDPYALTATGIVGFDHVDMVEDIPPAVRGDFPDLLFDIPETMLVIEPSGAARIVAMHVGSDDEEIALRQRSIAADRLARLAARIDQAVTPPIAPARGANTSVDTSDAEFAATVERLKSHVAAGNIFQAVPSRVFSAPCADPVSAFRRLVGADPSAYHYICDTGYGVLLGASPETAMQLRPHERGTTVSVSPIAGTRPRGATDDADSRMEAELRLDDKEIAEHMMLVDLARNDVARVAKAGSRRVVRMLDVERFAKVMHLVSEVEGELAEGRDAVDAIRSCLNVGTLSGAPKLKAIELIRSVERTPRGPYGGAIFALTSAGAMDSAVVIRSALVSNGIASVRAGAGVVADSDPAAEAAETRAKARALLEALGAAA